MNRQSVDSRHIRSVAWDPATRSLEVEFEQGRVYRYAEVSYETWAGFMRAESKGSYLRKNIAPHHRAEEVAV